jgi:hypothetical protein
MVSPGGRKALAILARLARRLSVPVALAIACASVAGAQTTPLDSAEVRRWREDLAFLRAAMPANHANLFHTMGRASFDSALASIDARLPTLARHQVIVELQRLAARIGDGHSNVSPWRDPAVGFRTLPVVLYAFEDGMFVRAATAERRDLLGRRVLAIGGVPIDSAMALVRPLIGRDNEMGAIAWGPVLLGIPEVLHALGLAKSPERVTMTLERGGARRDVTLDPAGPLPLTSGEPDRSWIVREGWVDASETAPRPLWLTDPGNLYWYRFLPESRAMYAQLNAVQPKDGDSLAAFMSRTLAAADSAGAERLVLDLRLNGGGNGHWIGVILPALIRSRYNQPGKLFVLTGRRTWSAAQMLVSEIEKYTHATFVGEPTASRGNHYGDSRRLTLPNSKVTFRVSTLYWQFSDPRDTRPWITPAIEAPLTFSAYAAGRDPALEAALGSAGP